MKGYLAILVCFLMFFSVFGLACREKSPATSEVPESSSPAETTVENAVVSETPAEEAPTLQEGGTIPTEPVDDSAAVTVNGVDITEADVEARLKPQLAQMASRAGQLPPEFFEQLKQQLREKTVDMLVVEKLLDEKIRQANIVVTEEDVTEQIKTIGAQQQPPLSVDDLRQRMAAVGQSFDEMKSQIRRRLSYQKFLEAEFADRINVTEEDAKKYYAKNQRQFQVPEMVRASHILVKKPDTSAAGTDPNQAKAAAKAKAEGLLKQIKEEADFGALARANSDCPSSQKGGDLDFFSRDRMVPAFSQAAFELEVGQVSDVVETQFGYHIIKVTDHKDPDTITFEQARDDIINTLTRQKQGELAGQYIESLKAQAIIVYPPGKEPKPATAPPPRP